jgi:hypothetical protein
MSLISNTNIQFHNYTDIRPELQLFNNNDYQFGIFNIQMANNINILMTEQYMHFTIDCSGSMDDICQDRRSKMDHLKFTIKNILRWLVNKNVNVYIEIDAFDSIIKPIVSLVKLTNDNIEDIIKKITNIQPEQLTNIELALDNICKKVNAVGILNPHFTINEIFLTDGEVTQGSTNISELISLLDNKIKYTFVGFGEDHDSNLLVTLSNNCNGTYRFIDAIEKSSLIYGEILNQIFYLCYDDVIICIDNGEIYDYKTNTWQNQINIPGLVSEEVRTFHLRSLTKEVIKVNVVGIELQKSTYCGELINQTHIVEINDINRYIFRQRVLELLYEARVEVERVRKEVTNNYRLFRWFNKEEDTSNTSNNNINKNNVKKQIKDLLEQIKSYIINNNLTNDNFLKLLCDDLYVAYKTLDNNNGHKYIAARQISQGCQQVYTVNYTVNCFNDNDNDNNEHELSTVKDSPYRTTNCSNIMRDVSVGTQAEDDI